MPDFFGMQALPPGHAWVPHVAAAAAISFYYLVRLLLAAGTPWAPGERSARPVTHDFWRSKRRSRSRPFLTTMILEWGGEGVFLGNPVFQKEIRTEFFGRVGYRRLVFWSLCAVFGLVLLGKRSGFREVEEEVTTMAGIAVVLLVLLAPGLAASAFPREIEHGNIDFLRSTLLSPWEVLRGKFLAALYATFGVIAAAGWGIGIAAWSGPWQAPWNLPADHEFVIAFLLPMGILVAIWIFVTAVATCASVVTKRTLPALVASYVTLAAWFLAVPVLSGGVGISLDDLSIAVAPISAVGAVFRGGQAMSLLGFFFFYAALILAAWHVARLEVEVLGSQDD